MEPLSALNGHPNSGEGSRRRDEHRPAGPRPALGRWYGNGGQAAGHVSRVFVIVGDGELQEGSNWEALMAAGQSRLDNLIVVVDRNRLQQGDRTERNERTRSTRRQARCFRTGGRATIDGHDYGARSTAFERRPTTGARSA